APPTLDDCAREGELSRHHPLLPLRLPNVEVIEELFGSWAIALEAASEPRGPVSRPPAEADLELEEVVNSVLPRPSRPELARLLKEWSRQRGVPRGPSMIEWRMADALRPVHERIPIVWFIAEFGDWKSALAAAGLGRQAASQARKARRDAPPTVVRAAVADWLALKPTIINKNAWSAYQRTLDPSARITSQLVSDVFGSWSKLLTGHLADAASRDI
ncbi:MAG: hypothetical protein H7287_00590, partial [Thermoleophilia bacterium]|nr:hypothetical protein [Thermoleophilia bacterium]